MERFIKLGDINFRPKFQWHTGCDVKESDKLRLGTRLLTRQHTF